MQIVDSEEKRPIIFKTDAQSLSRTRKRKLFVSWLFEYENFQFYRDIW